jgi:GTP cyclohydrolase I
MGQEANPLAGVPLTRIVEISDRLFPFEEAEPWDNCGIQIGDPKRLVTAMAFGLDPTPYTVAFAAEHSCELLVTHHPVLLEPLRSITPDDLAGKTLLQAAKAGVDILSLHTNLDAAEGGLNDHLAEVLGLNQVTVPHPARCARLGSLPAPVPVTGLGQVIARNLALQSVRIISADDRLVQKVFCASGSGMGYLRDAVACGAEVIVTGDVRYHAAREAMEMGIAVIDAGHFGLEKEAVGLLASRFRDEFSRLGLDLVCIPCESETDPYILPS